MDFLKSAYGNTKKEEEEQPEITTASSSIVKTSSIAPEVSLRVIEGDFIKGRELVSLFVFFFCFGKVHASAGGVSQPTGRKSVRCKARTRTTLRTEQNAEEQQSAVGLCGGTRHGAVGVCRGGEQRTEDRDSEGPHDGRGGEGGGTQGQAQGKAAR